LPAAFEVEITDATEFHCFRLIINPPSAPGQRIEIMMHARSVVDLIHALSSKLCDWQYDTTAYLLGTTRFDPPGPPESGQ
jgi:hypothetical protein